MTLMHTYIHARSGRFLLLLLLCIISTAFTGCGNSDDDTGPTTPTSLLSGVFVDSPVSGLNYSTPTISGTTDSEGAFDYSDGETVTFSIGDLVLGAAPGADTLSPIDIVAGAVDATDPQTNNICVLLQTIDQDGNLNNGIQINDAITAIVSSHAAGINLNQTTAAFAADANVAALLAELNGAGVFNDTDTRDRMLMDAENAREHLQRSLGERIVTHTANGDVRGFAADANTWAWYGIPYAAPPLNDLRWQPPQPVADWNGIREATAWSDQAAQTPMYQRFGEGGMSEDCLYLNVVAPKDADNLPVMVWFHGGGFRILTGNAKSFNNTALPSKGVVVVTVVHRLGPFGYLAHPALSAESEHGVSGNYGQLDLIAALKWVKTNIAEFGGNPDNVTIFGESGGGGKVISLMTSPLAQGLFHKAICESGQAASDDVINPAASLTAAEAKGEEIAAILGVDGAQDVAAAMRALSWTEIIEALDAAGIEYSPNVDFNEALGQGWYMPQTMEETFAAHLHNDVPFIAGANEGDMAALIEGFKEQMPWIAQNNDHDVFTYVFSHVPAGWSALGVKAYHGIELVYVFDYPISFITHHLLKQPGTDYSSLTGLTDADIGADPNSPAYYTTILSSTGYFSNIATEKKVANNVMTMWANFAATGNPGVPGVIEWPAYTGSTEGGGNDTYLNIGEDLIVDTGLAEAFPPAEEPPVE